MTYTKETLKQLGKFLTEQGFDPDHVISVFEQSDKYYEPIMHIDAELEKSIAYFCEMNGIEFTEFLGLFDIKDCY